MRSKIFNLMLIIVISAILLGSLSYVVFADDWNPPQNPGEPPHDSGGASSGPSGGSGGSMPAFQTYSKDVLSTNGSVIGTLTATDYNNVNLHAGNNFTIGNENVSVIMDAALNGMPTSQKMDIALGSSARLPPGMRDVKPLVVLNVTMYSGDWGIKQGSAKFTINISKALLNGSDAYTGYCFVRSDDAGYQVFDAARVEDNSTVSFSFASQYEGMSQKGSEGLALVAVLPEPTATPVPTAVTQSKAGGPFTNNIPLLLIAFILVAAVSGAIVYMMVKKK